MSDRIETIAGVILAGGLARRMGGGDKPMIELAGRPLLAHVIDRLVPQVGHVVLNANGDPNRFAGFGLEVIADPIAGAAGPLAGVLAGLEWASAQRPAIDWLVSVAADTPFFPDDLVARLLAETASGKADMACAMSNDRAHPVFGLWPVGLTAKLRSAVIGEGIRKVDMWTGRYNCVAVAFDDEGIDPFFNVNRPEDLDRAQALLQGVTA
jgi:molybdopterin-guanine dinucleotide biosynthesis protein A